MKGKRMKSFWTHMTLFGVLLIFAGPLSSYAGETESFSLPSSLTVVEEEAFAGDTSISDLKLPEGTQEIGARAFADTQLYTIGVPESVINIAEDAFEGVTTPLLMETAAGSIAVSFALANNVDFRAETDCRALLIGQTAYPSPNELEGPAKDVVKVKNLLSGSYKVTVRENLSASEILSAISETFSAATPEDISLFYYGGHGLSSSNSSRNGSLVGIDFSTYVTAGQLRNALDTIPGRKIVIIDACYSGGLIGRKAELSATSESAAAEEDGAAAEVTEVAGNPAVEVAESAVEAPAVSFMNSFTSGKLRSRGNLAAQPYFVLVSSTGTEQSWEASSGGVFTYAFAQSASKADSNGDGVVTLQECYEYTAARVSSIVGTNDLVQSVQVYPEGCGWFGMFR